MFELLVFLIAAVAGSVAAIAGFGIGSLLTPVFALHMPLKLAVAAVSVPHLIATALRFMMMRPHVDWKLLKSFGIFSAVGGLLGALAHRWASSPALAIVFGAALLLAAASELTGAARRVRLTRGAAWIAGGVSGVLGGLVGNQGGIRSAALLGFRTTRDSFVATATAVALLVDGARMPVYLALQGNQLRMQLPAILIACAGVVLGTLWGRRALEHMPDRAFRRAVSVLILLLGVFMLARGFGAL